MTCPAVATKFQVGQAQTVTQGELGTHATQKITSAALCFGENYCYNECYILKGVNAN